MRQPHHPPWRSASRVFPTAQTDQGEGKLRFIAGHVVWNAVVLLLVAAAAAHAHAPPPSEPLGFVPPAPGSYRLQAIMPTPDGEVLDTLGRARGLAEFTRGKITLVGLIYTRCSDAEGCPRSWAAFAEVRRLIKTRPALARRTRLVSLSFDPAHDTPAIMKKVASAAAGRDKSVEWDFLTTASPRKLWPILDGFGQDVRLNSETSEATEAPALSHTLKVFLIDRDGQVREIYTTSFLIPQVIVNDVATLALEEARAPRAKELAGMSR